MKGMLNGLYQQTEAPSCSFGLLLVLPTKSPLAADNNLRHFATTAMASKTDNPSRLISPLIYGDLLNAHAHFDVANAICHEFLALQLTGILDADLKYMI